MAGIKSPLLTAPLGTYTGWNVTTSGRLQGPAVRLELRRVAHRRVHPVREDESRAHWRAAIRGCRSKSGTRDHDGYVSAVKAAADEARARWVSSSPEDAAAMVAQAEQSRCCGDVLGPTLAQGTWLGVNV